MGRRKALAIAGAISISAMTAALAIGANFGLFGLTGGSGTQVGNFAAEAPGVAAPASAVVDAPGAPAAEPAPEIIVVEAPAPAATLFAEPTEPPPVITAADPDPEPEPAPAVLDDHDDSDDDDDDDSGHGRGRNRGSGSGGDDDRDEDEDDDDSDDDD
jgi:hypothetical protein